MKKIIQQLWKVFKEHKSSIQLGTLQSNWKGLWASFWRTSNTWSTWKASSKPSVTIPWFNPSTLKVLDICRRKSRVKAKTWLWKKCPFLNSNPGSTRAKWCLERLCAAFILKILCHCKSLMLNFKAFSNRLIVWIFEFLAHFAWLIESPSALPSICTTWLRAKASSLVTLWLLLSPALQVLIWIWKTK